MKAIVRPKCGRVNSPLSFELPLVQLAPVPPSIRLRLGEDGQIVGEDVLGDVGDDFDDFRVRKTRLAQRRQVRVADLPALQNQRLGETQHLVRLRLRRRGPAGGLNLRLRQPGVPACDRMGREAVVGAAEPVRTELHPANPRSGAESLEERVWDKILHA